ncbi:hypothetical protein IWW50_002439 [Coemansia erecta]|nr:hypothetical protein IWW50_002439 [Coemansia erecta]
MISPCARFTSHGIGCPALPPGQSIDYSMTSPLQSGWPLCKYSTPWPTPAATWTAGKQVTVKLAPGGATHDQIWVPAISRAPEFYMGCNNAAIKGGLTPYTGK